MTLPESTNDPLGSSEASWNLLARYLANELSAEEREKFVYWIGENAQRMRELALLQRLWDDAAWLPSRSRMLAMWWSISQHAEADVPPSGVDPNAPLMADESAGEPPPDNAPPSNTGKS